MFGSKVTTYHCDELEIGATGPRKLQFVLREGKQTAVVQLTSDGARALIHSLDHWAAVADQMADDS